MPRDIAVECEKTAAVPSLSLSVKCVEFGRFVVNCAGKMNSVGDAHKFDRILLLRLSLEGPNFTGQVHDPAINLKF